MNLLARVSYKVALLTVAGFFAAGVLLGLVCLSVCACLRHRRAAARRTSAVLKFHNQVEMANMENQRPDSNNQNNQNDIEDKQEKEEEGQVVQDMKETSGDDDSAARKRMELQLIINKRKSSMVIKKSYPLLDLSQVESKYMKAARANDPRFTNYLKRSRRSFLGYDPDSSN